ncbi:ABC transporter ATP-binding protein [Natrinema salinisoli]|uniref:ABC transporter ATP-binding protein n=1 Tax=Natrinema salinisoli TaxID=2878535 RepID=UPI001CF06431|nr:ABC transporter ATP-binding protein [Natrinema salinisoli]
MADPVLEIDGLDVTYGKTQALDDVSLRVEEGETVGVIGPNGAGKTTLFDTLSGIKEYEGSIKLFGEELSELSKREIVDRGLVHCSEEHDLFPFFSVHENLLMGAYPRDDQEAARETIDWVYELFPRLDERREQDAETLSGGEQQMLAIGRALVSDPKLLILDEPTLGLAPVIIDDLDDTFEQLKREGITILIAEQNTTFAMRHAERLYLLETGEITLEGPAAELREDDYVRDAYIGVT